MIDASESLPVKMGLSTLPRRMTRKQAMRYALAHIPRDLQRAGFVASIFRSSLDIHDGEFFRINYSK
jgi:hypothetical protein